MVIDLKVQAVLSGDGSGLPARMTYAEHEWHGVHAQKVRLADRMKHVKDTDMKPDNDNRIDWPLSRAMLQDGNHDLLKTAIKYRTIHEKATSEPLLGEGSVPTGELVILHRTEVRQDGTLKSHGEVFRKSGAAVEYPAQRSVPTTSDSKKKAAPIPKPWTGDRAVNDAIDARALLARLRERLGPLAEPLEMAVVDGATLQECGNAVGIANRAGAMGAGKAVVYQGLIMVRDYLHK